MKKNILFLLWFLFSGVIFGALWFQAQEGWRSFTLGGWVVLLIVGIFLIIRNKLYQMSIMLLSCISIFTVWWINIPASNSREWAQDVMHGVTGSINGEQVTLQNVRNFAWQTPEQAEAHWETRSYDLSHLISVDLISSTWSSQAIAHTLISFGFQNGEHIVFSAEIRKEYDEEFSEIAGFFKAYELVLIAADERDIIHLRTNIRKESVSLYKLEIPNDIKRQLFLEFIELGNDLSKKPRFYNTLTTNCTTVIFKLARLLDPALALDWRILLSGYVPEYLYDHNLINKQSPLKIIKEQARISSKGLRAGNSSEFSALIRQ